MFKPMLAGSVKPPYDLPLNRFPMLVSPKLDGVRATIQDGKVLSRSLKPIANQFIQEVLGGFPYLQGLDGEFIVGNPTDPDVFRRTSSQVNTITGKPNFTYYVFDTFSSWRPFTSRLEIARNTVKMLNAALDNRLAAVPHEEVHTQERLMELEQQWTLEGYEGVMIRSLYGKYKEGRSTFNEGALLKLKRFEDAEAIVIGFEELMRNGNEAKINALGHMERSSHKENLIPGDMLGVLQVRDVKTGVEFGLGSGFKEVDRHEIWQNKDKFMGRLVTYKYQAVGVKDKPRIPIFKGFRDHADTDLL
jgi:DNA ligase-1